MNWLLAVAIGGVMLFLIGRSILTVYIPAWAELSSHDRRVALAIVAIIFAAFIAVVVVLQLMRR